MELLALVRTGEWELNGRGRGRNSRTESESMAAWCRCRSRSVFCLQLLAVFAAVSAGKPSRS
jgi:hypothetical protein